MKNLNGRSHPKTTITVRDNKDFEAAFYVDSDNSENPPVRYSPHIHDTVEIYFLLEGESSFSVENRMYRLNAGDAVISMPDELHYCLRKSASPHAHACIWFDPNSKFLFGDFFKTDKRHIVLAEDKKKELIFQLKKLETAADARDKYSEYVILIYILGLIHSALAVADENDNGIAPYPAVLKNVLDYISANFATIKSVGEITEKYFISRSSLSRLFNKYLHVSPKVYLESKKLSFARKLLKSGSSVYSAAEEAGFSDCSNFIRLFKLRFGVTPARYKSNPSLDFLYNDNVIDN